MRDSVDCSGGIINTGVTFNHKIGNLAVPVFKEPYIWARQLEVPDDVRKAIYRASIINGIATDIDVLSREKRPDGFIAPFERTKGRLARYTTLDKCLREELELIISPDADVKKMF